VLSLAVSKLARGHGFPCGAKNPSCGTICFPSCGQNFCELFGKDCVENMARPNLFVAASRIEASAEELFRWHAEPDALERLTPPWERIEIIERARGIRDGDRGAMWVYMGPFRLRWNFEHRDYIEGRQFRDVQTSGPFRHWEHTHLFTPESADACRLEDRIEYELPFGALGNLLGGWLVRRKLARVFEYRHRVTAEAMRTGSEGSRRD
jgi:ligand-binding SRPBCC domain-containing protein